MYTKDKAKFERLVKTKRAVLAKRKKIMATPKLDKEIATAIKANHKPKASKPKSQKRAVIAKSIAEKKKVTANKDTSNKRTSNIANSFYCLWHREF